MQHNWNIIKSPPPPILSSLYGLNSILKDKILDYPKLKACADDKCD